MRRIVGILNKNHREVAVKAVLKGGGFKHTHKSRRYSRAHAARHCQEHQVILLGIGPASLLYTCDDFCHCCL